MGTQLTAPLPVAVAERQTQGFSEQQKQWLRVQKWHYVQGLGAVDSSPSLNPATADKAHRCP